MCIGFVDSIHGITNLYPTQLGRIVETRPEGVHVKKGEWLLKIDSRLAELRRKQAEKLPEIQKLKIMAIQCQKRAADLEIAIKKRSADRGIADAVDALAAAKELAKQLDYKIKAEELVESQAVYDYEQALLAVKECEVVAPADGTLMRSLVHVGEVLGANPKFPPMQFVPDGKKIIRAEILQEWAGRFKENQPVTIVDDTYTGPEWHGTITLISNWYAHKRSIIFEPFTLNDVRTLECIVEVTEKDAPFRIGQRVRVGVLKTGP